MPREATYCCLLLATTYSKSWALEKPPVLQEPDVGESPPSCRSPPTQQSGTRKQSATSCKLFLAPSSDKYFVCSLVKEKYSKSPNSLSESRLKWCFWSWGNKLVTGTRAYNIERINSAKIFFQCASCLKTLFRVSFTLKHWSCRPSELCPFSLRFRKRLNV